MPDIVRYALKRWNIHATAGSPPGWWRYETSRGIAIVNDVRKLCHAQERFPKYLLDAELLTSIADYSMVIKRIKERDPLYNDMSPSERKNMCNSFEVTLKRLKAEREKHGLR